MEVYTTRHLHPEYNHNVNVALEDSLTINLIDNPNNVAVEASPLSTVMEIEVGMELAKLVGFSGDRTKTPVGWGHITADGSIANLESMWAGKCLTDTFRDIPVIQFTLSAQPQVLPFVLAQGYEK